MSEPLWLQGLVLVSAGAVAGGITNSVGAWLLFHPSQPVRLGPFTLHGIIPKKQARLAQAIEGGQAGAEVERAVRRFIAGQRDALLHDERPVLDRLPPGLVAALEQGITDHLPTAVKHLIHEGVVAYLSTPIADRLWALGPDRLDSLEQAAGDYAAAALQAPETRAWALELTRVEELLRKASEKELRLTVWLGCGLGAMVGAVAWGLTRLFG